MSYKNKKSVLNGVVILSIAAGISKLLGTLQKIPLQNWAGDLVFGLYNVVYPTYLMFLMLAVTAFPMAISKFVAEYEANGDHLASMRMIRVSFVVLGMIGMVSFIFVFWGAEWIASLLGHGQATLALKTVAFSLLIIPFLSTFRGYFQGKQLMNSTATSQVAEQFIRVITLVGFLIYFLSIGASAEVITAGAMFGSVAGSIAGLCVMLAYWFTSRRADRLSELRTRRSTDSSQEPFISIVWRMLKYAIPLSASALIFPIMNFVDAITVPRLLQQSVYSVDEAMIQFGIYSRGQTLAQFVMLMVGSVSVAILPMIVSYMMKRDREELTRRVSQILRLGWSFSLAATVGLWLIKEAVNVTLFKNELGSVTIGIYGTMVVFGVVSVLSATILQGMNRVYVPAFVFCSAIVIKFILNSLFVTWYGVNGAAISTTIAFAIAAALCLGVLYRLINFRLSLLTWIIQPGIALIVMVCVCLSVEHLHTWLFSEWILTRIGQAYETMMLCIFGSGSFLVVYRMVGGVGK